MRRVSETLSDDILKRWAHWMHKRQWRIFRYAQLMSLPLQMQLSLAHQQIRKYVRTDEITGCSPYGASTIAGGKGERMPSKTELDGARFQGRHVAGIAARLAG